MTRIDFTYLICMELSFSCCMLLKKKSCCAYETLIAVVLGFYLVIKSSSPELNVSMLAVVF